MNVSIKSHRSPRVAAVISVFVPGLGQVYAGNWKRGLSILIGLVAQGALFYGVKMPWLIAWMSVVWAWNVWDGYCSARGCRSSAMGPVLLILVLNVVAAWKVTDIHTPQFQQQQREVIGSIVSGIGHPDFAARKSRKLEATGKFVVPGPGAPISVEQSRHASRKPYIEIKPLIAVKGQRVTVIGGNFAHDAVGKLVLLSGDEMDVAEFKTNSGGQFKASFVNPREIPGDYFVQARMQVASSGWSISETLHDAAPRMLETIYLAFIGTALSLLFALPLSFLGARNLMSSAPPLKLVYGVVRGLFSVLRSVEVLIIAVIAVAAVGIGPFAGVLA
ncbi:MAG: hypothetical protein ABFD54_06010, partial [Armatimonadota bacterium]